MSILSLTMQSEENIDKIVIDWKRGDKKSSTRSFYTITPDQRIAEINETFKKLSLFFKDEKKGTFQRKMV